jgi:hypothetical protein
MKNNSNQKIIVDGWSFGYFYWYTVSNYPLTPKSARTADKRYYGRTISACISGSSVHHGLKTEHLEWFWTSNAWELLGRELDPLRLHLPSGADASCSERAVVI